MPRNPLSRRGKTALRVRTKHLAPLIPMLFLLAENVALATDSGPAKQIESPWRLGVALGYGQRSNPLVLSDDITIVVDLDVAWFGEHWFFDNGDLGLTVVDQDWYTLNLVGRFNSDRVFFGKTNSKFISVNNSLGEPVPVQARVPDRDYAIEAGVEFLADGNWGDLQVTAFRDISSTHGGYELYAEYSFSLRKQRWLYQPSLGLSWKSDKLNNYYWGVRASEANPLFPAYQAGAGLNVQARFLTSFQVNTHWAFIAVAEYEHINSEAAASPLVKEHAVVGVFAGFKYEY